MVFCIHQLITINQILITCCLIACAIQYCLAKRDHKEHLCQAYIDDWKNCCDKVRAASATTAAKEGD